jgi:hypothetical protein
VWIAVAAVLTLNLVLLMLGMSAISSVSSSVEDFSSTLGDVVREMQNTKVLQARELEEATLAAARREPEAPAVTSGAGPRVEVEPFARGELKAARAEIDRGEFSNARRRLFRLLATIDDPLSEDETFAEEQANLLIAESFVAESNAIQGAQR